MDKFETFTDTARKVLTYAQEEAQRFNHNYIGAEHLLLGLLREREGIAVGVLESHGVSLERLRSVVLQYTSRVVRQDTSGTEPVGSPTIGGLLRPDVVALLLDADTLTALDLLVGAGVVEAREDAAMWFLQAGITSSGNLLASLGATVEEIERLRDEARRRAREALDDEEDTAR